jgi:hypothetical protein
VAFGICFALPGRSFGLAEHSNHLRKKETPSMNNGKRKKWTLMFFFASDNNLSPSMLTQIKAIKSAGYQEDTNVLLHFDPNEKGAPTRVFEVNQKDSQSNRASRIGDGAGSLVSVLTGDDITPRAVGKLSAEEIDEMEATVALEKFLTLCREDYPADHYMLFLVGHGMVVGGDGFLPDDNPISAIGLEDLENALKTFSDAVKSDDGCLELLAMHSCSMSGVEVAYQLQGAANYMLASQGISFIGAWPYRQLLITIFRAIQAERDDPNNAVNVLDLVEKLHDLCIQHSADFMVGGYSADLCLCTLNSTNVTNLSEPIKNLGEALQAGLHDPRCRHFILLAHWKSQSYWQETYTDLYDFCLCLRRLCIKQEQSRHLQDARPPTNVRAYDAKQKAIENACLDVMSMLAPKKPGPKTGPIIRTDFIGAGSQYSHGLSIYFPWSEPVEDKQERALTNYKKYEFGTGPTMAWLEFLKLYFEITKRPSRLREDSDFKDQDVKYQSDPQFQQALAAARKAFSIPGLKPGNPQSVPTAQEQLDQKINPPDAGGGCMCPSIKNYSKEFLMSPGAAAVFIEPSQNPGSNERAA